MEGKRDYYYCQRGNGNENVNTALFTAGIVLLLKNDEEMKKQKGNCNEIEACKEELILNSKKRSNTEAEEKLEKEKLVEENIEPPKLSKEELNERVEAFNAMFRQHLALDGRKGRDKFYVDRKQADMKKYINLF
ncbi:hypothetical protein CRYUN_Cryun22dG0022400 [Craigia yunnanensis]